ncbi:hypothetical protein PR048_021891, partial [Dryococelus australis]
MSIVFANTTDSKIQHWYGNRVSSTLEYTLPFPHRKLHAAHLPLVSPCSPMIQPWQLLGATFTLSDMRKRNLEESRLVPEPITRFLGNPLSFHATILKAHAIPTWPTPTIVTLLPEDSLGCATWRFGRLLTSRSLEPMWVIEVSMEQRRNERAGETEDPREDPPTNGIVRHDSHMRNPDLYLLIYPACLLNPSCDSYAKKNATDATCIELIAENQDMDEYRYNLENNESGINLCGTMWRGAMVAERLGFPAGSPRFSQVGIVPNDAVCRRVFSGNSPPFHYGAVPYHNHCGRGSTVRYGYATRWRGTIRGRCGVGARSLAPQQREPRSIPDFRTWESCRTMPLVGVFSRVSFVSPRPSIPTLLHTHFASPSSALKTALLEAVQISPLT